jgi:hypothetical protein
MSQNSFRKSRGTLKYKQNETVEEENTEEVTNSNYDDDNSISKEQESIREETGFDLSDSGQKIPPEDESTIQENLK